MEKNILRKTKEQNQTINHCEGQERKEWVRRKNKDTYDKEKHHGCVICCIGNEISLLHRNMKIKMEGKVHKGRRNFRDINRRERRTKLQVHSTPCEMEEILTIPIISDLLEKRDRERKWERLLIKKQIKSIFRFIFLLYCFKILF